MHSRNAYAKTPALTKASSQIPRLYPNFPNAGVRVSGRTRFSVGVVGTGVSPVSSDSDTGERRCQTAQTRLPLRKITKSRSKLAVFKAKTNLSLARGKPSITCIATGRIELNVESSR